MTTTIDVSEVPQQISRLLELSRDGNEVVVAVDEMPVAHLTAIAPEVDEAPPRVPGLHRGMGTMSDDFNAPLPDEFWLGTE